MVDNEIVRKSLCGGADLREYWNFTLFGRLDRNLLLLQVGKVGDLHDIRVNKYLFGIEGCSEFQPVATDK